MSDLILYIVKSLVTNPDAVTVEESHDEGQTNLLLTVDPVDMGLVIGKGGQTIKAIRKVLIVKAMADNVRVNLQLAEPEGGRPEKSEPSEQSEDQSASEPETKTDVAEQEETENEDQAEETTEEKIDPAIGTDQVEESETQPSEDAPEDDKETTL